MTDLTQAPDVALAPPSLQPGALEKSLNTVLKSAPELGQSPGLAVGVAQSGGNTELRAQSLARTTTAMSDQRAQNRVAPSAGGGNALTDALNWFGNSVSHVAGDVGHDIVSVGGTAVKDTLSTLNKPLQFVQHEYRYLHDVEASHGMLPAIAEGLGIAAGATAGFFGGGVEGAVLGGEAVAGIEGQVFYRDSWARTASASYVDPRTHQPVSLGRDIASLLGLKAGSMPYKVSSGLMDGIADLGLDPLAVGGKLSSAARDAEGAPRLLNRLAPGTNPTRLADALAGHGPVTGEDFDRAYDQVVNNPLYGNVRRAFDDIAGKSASEVAVAYPQLRDIATQLGEAQTRDDVAQVLKEVFRTHELAFTDKLPTLSWTRANISQPLRNFAGNYGGPLAENALVGPQRWSKRFEKLSVSYDSVKKQISGHEFNPASKVDDGTSFVYNMLRFTETKRVAHSVADVYANAPDIATKVRIYRNATLNLLFSMGGFRDIVNWNDLADEGYFNSTRAAYLARMFDNPNDKEAMAKILDDAVAGGMFGHEAIYGLDDQGRVLSLVKDANGDWQYGAAILEGQDGPLSGIDLGEARRAAKMIAGAREIFDAQNSNRLARALAGGDIPGRLDDALYRAVTQGVFKPLVLLTPSYAMHISLAELIPNVLRAGVLNLAKAGIAINAAKLGVKAGAYEEALERVGDAAADLDRALQSGDEARISVAERKVEELERVASKTGYRSGMDRAIAGLAWRLVGGTRDSSELRELIQNPDALATSAFGQRVQLAARYIEHLDGQFVIPGLSTAHYSPTELGQREEVSSRFLRHAVARSTSGKTFGTYGRADKNFVDHWQAWLKEIASDRPSQIAARELLAGARRGEDLDTASGNAAHAVAEWMRAQPEGELDWALRSNPNLSSISKDGRPYVTSFANGLPEGMDQYDDWARVIVANLRGATRGADGTLHVPLLDYIANADKDLPESLHYPADELDKIGFDQRPRDVKGRETVPDGTSTIQRIANVGFTRILNPMVNFLSRQPIAFEEFERQWKQLEPLVDRGVIDEDEAMSRAMDRTVQAAVRQIHNIHDRTQWTVTMRNWAPFWFAQEQAYRRMGRLLAEDPGAFRRYQLMIANIHDVGQVFQGPNGNGYFVIPGTGFLTSGATMVANSLFGSLSPVETATPVGMGWNLSASSVIFPLSAGARPDVGPLVAVPVQAIAQLFPEMAGPALKADVTAGANALLGNATASQDVWSQLIPNTVLQRLATAGGLVDQRSFMSTMMQTLQTLDYEHKIPPADADYMTWQRFIDRVKNQTRIMYVMKALVGAVTPVSPEVTDPTYDKFSGELSADIQKYGSVTKGVQAFLSKNPDATPYTVFESYSPTGSTPPDSVEAENWINDNQAFIKAHPYSAFYFMPQLTDTKYNATVYNEQLAQGYRVKYDPTANPVGNIGSSFLAQLYIAAGNAFVLDNPENYPAYKKAIASQTGTQKYETELAWQNFITQYSNQNPVWGEWWNQDTKSLDRAQAIKEIQQMIAENEIPNPDSPQSQGIVAIMQGYQDYQNQLAAGRQDAFATQSQSSITQEWNDNLLTIAQRHPELAPFINGVFTTVPGVRNG